MAVVQKDLLPFMRVRDLPNVDTSTEDSLDEKQKGGVANSHHHHHGPKAFSRGESNRIVERENTKTGALERWIHP